MSAEDKERSAATARRRWREAVPNDRLAHHVKDLLRGITRAMQIRLMDHQVSMGYWAFLRILWEKDGITQRELSDLAGVSEPTTYSALRAMETLGFITRRKLPTNQRNINVSLTPEGRALKDKLIPLAVEVNTVLIKGIPPRNVAIFRQTMLEMMKNLEQDELEMDRQLPPLRKIG